MIVITSSLSLFVTGSNPRIVEVLSLGISLNLLEVASGDAG
jgi:hypothetical protein